MPHLNISLATTILLPVDFDLAPLPLNPTRPECNNSHSPNSRPHARTTPSQALVLCELGPLETQPTSRFAPGDFRLDDYFRQKRKERAGRRN